MVDRSSWRIVQLHGGCPWGFRLSESMYLREPGLFVSKVQTTSKAYSAGLRDYDTIIYINDLPTYNMTMHRASELIESLDTLSLIVINSSKLGRTTESTTNDSNRVIMNNSRRNQTFHNRSSARRQQTGYQQSHSVSSRRNYYSATESCGEETDTDSVFATESKPKQSYASITLRSPFREVNYFSDTEVRNPAKLGYSSNNKVKNQQPKPFYPPKYVSHSIYQQASSNQGNNQVNTMPSSYKEQGQHKKPPGSYSLLGQNRHNASSNEHYAQQPFKVPNIYDKLSMQQPHMHQQFRPYFAPHDTEESNTGYFANNMDNSPEIKRSTIGVQKYADSYFYNSPYVNYPTIDDQKKLAREIASTLEGSDPDHSKYHKYKKRQQIADEEYYAQTGGMDSYMLDSSGQGSDLHSSYVYDHNIPEVIRRSIAQAEMHDPIRSVHAQEQFKQLHYTEHTTHTEMPPQAAMSIAASLHQSGGRGAQMFQKQRLKSEKHVTDESNVKPSASVYLEQPVYDNGHGMSKLAPLVKREPKEPVEVQHVPVTPIIPLKSESGYQNKFSDFNVNPRGWNSSADHYSSAKNYNRQGSIAEQQSIREGIQELHFSSSEQSGSNRQQPTSLTDSVYGQRSTRINVNPWNAQRIEVHAHKDSTQNTMPVSKDGIHDLKQRYYTNVQNADNRESMHVSKVTLNRLNTNDFLTSPAGNHAASASANSRYARQSEPANYGDNYYNENIASSEL